MSFIARGTPTSARTSGRTALGNLGFIHSMICLALCDAFMCSGGCYLWHLLVLIECIGVVFCYGFPFNCQPCIQKTYVQPGPACFSSLIPCNAFAIPFWRKSKVQQWAPVYTIRGWSWASCVYIYNAWLMSSQCLCGVMLQLAFLSVFTIGLGTPGQDQISCLG